MALPNARALYEGLCGAIRSNHDRWEGNWTPTVWDYLTEVGKPDGLLCKMNPTETTRQNSEWLIDFLLTRGEVGTEGFKSIELACEYEASSSISEIRYDFQKLLVVKSPLKIFIGFALVAPGSADMRLAAIREDVDRCRLSPGEELLALIIQPTGQSRERTTGTFAVAQGMVFGGVNHGPLGPTELAHAQ